MIFYSKDDISCKFKKLYDDGTVFGVFLECKEMFPYVLKLKTLKEKFIVENFAQLSNEIEKLQKLKLDISYREFKFKKIGSQKLPVSLTCKTAEDFLDFIDKKDEFYSCKTSYYVALEKFLSLKKLFIEKPRLLFEKELHKILDIVAFFLDNPKPNIYIRELPLFGVDTKFIENNKKTIDMFLMSVLDENSYNAIDKLANNGFEKKYGLKYKLPLVRFRILDCDLYINSMSDISITIEEFKTLNLGCKKVYMVENEVTALCFPDVKDAIVIFARGYSVGIFKSVGWLRDKEIYYWGDIDMDGFAILSQARGYFSQIKSLFMDEETIEEFSELKVKSHDKQYRELDNLTKNEMLVYDRLFCDYYGENFRLEQERLPVLSRILVK